VTTELPHRRYHLRLEVQGDTEADLLREFDDFVREVRQHGLACKLVSGGVTAGGFVQITQDPSTTHDSYFAALDEYKRTRPEAD
jgi:hypothetical protein